MDKLKIRCSLFVLLLSLITLYKPSFFFTDSLLSASNTSFTGWIITFTILILSVYSLKKRFFIMRFGTLNVWYDFHIYCGLLTLFLIPIHSNFLLGNGLSLFIFFSIYVVMVTGIYGVWIQMVIPGILLKEGVENMDYKNLIEKEGNLGRKMKLLEDTTKKNKIIFPKIIKKKKNKGLAPFFYSVVIGKHSVLGEDEQMNLIAHLCESEKKEYLQLIKTINDKNIVHNQLKLIRLMNTWLSFHIASVATLLVLITIHIFSYYYY